MGVSAGMVTTIADLSATIDFEAYEVNRQGGMSNWQDLCSGYDA